jgi:hypothetical protein
MFPEVTWLDRDCASCDEEMPRDECAPSLAELLARIDRNEETTRGNDEKGRDEA